MLLIDCSCVCERESVWCVVEGVFTYATLYVWKSEDNLLEIVRCVAERMCTWATVYVRKSEDNLLEFLLCFPPPGDELGCWTRRQAASTG